MVKPGALRSVILGDEAIDNNTLSLITRHIRDGESVKGIAACEDDRQFLVATSDRVLCVKKGALEFQCRYKSITHLDISTNWFTHGISIETSGASIYCPIGSKDVVEEIGRIIQSHMGSHSNGEHDGENAASQEAALTEEQTQIAEKVRFWEEQDAINKALIPRVIRQNELLAGHIAEHNNLPLVVARAVEQATDRVRDEQKELYDAALASMKAEFDEQSETQARQYDAALRSAHADFTDALDERTRRIRNISFVLLAASAVAILAISALIALLVG